MYTSIGYGSYIYSDFYTYGSGRKTPYRERTYKRQSYGGEKIDIYTCARTGIEPNTAIIGPHKCNNCGHRHSICYECKIARRKENRNKPKQNRLCPWVYPRVYPWVHPWDAYRWQLGVRIPKFRCSDP